MLTKSKRQSKTLAVPNTAYYRPKPYFSAELTLRKAFYSKNSATYTINRVPDRYIYNRFCIFQPIAQVLDYNLIAPTDAFSRFVYFAQTLAGLPKTVMCLIILSHIKA